MPCQKKDKSDLLIYYNDCIDPDNALAALALLRHMQRKAAASVAAVGTRIVWILEPRQVAFGLDMTKAHIDECKALITEHFPDRGLSPKVLLGGLLEDKDIESVRHKITASQAEVLRKAVRPTYGPRGDAELHVLLMGWDFANSLSDWALEPVRVLIDYDSLDELQNPVNLNYHFHEELLGRSLEEIDDHQAIMGAINNGSEINSQVRDNKDGIDKENSDKESSMVENSVTDSLEMLRGWYRRCIAEASENTNKRDNKVEALDFAKLCQSIRAASNVRFLGGSSLHILRRFINEGIADKIQCHLQVGSCDLSSNLFSNQFNIALNPEAASLVLDNFTSFARFTVVPSHSAQAVKYRLTDLAGVGGPYLERSILGFKCKEEPTRIATNQTTLQEDYKTKASPMPDLTSFMCELQPGFMGSKPGYVKLVHDGSTLLFERIKSNGSGDGDTVDGAIPILDIQFERELEAREVERLLQ